ncbi:pyridoxal 5'-phosphate synthase glutaminase subunit PdxT [Herbivorax sp. ANBcel31]|uniref:pyridoxal 5'-phosphate synthase glutaminase subunit PdxT n=1 Tax=Herbivorax sp. ANBcel31 TaxID=3069754 RepID=UPI0027ADCA0C|nr:pyridoxal 5'-phosphate synthase glutaminase subunit PdxT [Herbivorax sp. ANBcel31]MDQ2086913.1 pyridoxal 5'-phosphate synthase glutaminase subunit PdxT [Herbivorax sp. ANBcel31]
MKVGILSFQGSVKEHVNSIKRLGDVKPVEVRTVDELNSVDGLILPGGESTTLGNLLNVFNMTAPVREKIKSGMPVWGTCAGMILLAKEILEEENTHLSVMDIKVRRNAYGSQLDSFLTKGHISKVSKNELPLVFIRAPWIEEVLAGVDVLYQLDNKIVAAKQNNMLVTSFHPELTENLEFHRFFVDMIKEFREKKRLKTCV